MKKFLSFLSLALIAMLSFASCSSDNNEPGNGTPANYLVGKTFQEGDDPTADDNNWDFTRLHFTSNSKGVAYIEFVELGVAGTQDDTRSIIEYEFEYTYKKPTLSIKITKVIKATKLQDGVPVEDTSAQEDIGDVRTLVVDEELNTLTHSNGEKVRFFTLKK